MGRFNAHCLHLDFDLTEANEEWESVNVPNFLSLIEPEQTGQKAFCLDGSVSKISLAQRALTGFRVQSCYFQESEADVDSRRLPGAG